MAIFDTAAFDSMTAHVRAAYPREGCGILLGRREDGLIREAWMLRNCAGQENAGKRFLTDPLAVYRAEQDAARKGMEILGFYHSHPDCGVVPSKADEAFFIPGLLYIILSVARRHIGKISGYRRPEPDGALLSVPVETEETKL